MKKSVLLCLALWVCTHPTYGQKGPTKIKRPNSGTPIFERLDVPPPPPPPPPRLPPPPPPDSTELVKGLVKGFCDKLSENIKLGNVSMKVLITEGLSNPFVGENLTAIKWLSGDTTKYPKVRFALLEKGFRIAFRASLDECPFVDTFLGYDGRQRPAFAHLNQAICKCIGEKKASFKDPELALVKTKFITDSCSKSVFSDPEQLKIVYAANDFQSKAAIDTFDRNFRGYSFKNCPEFFENLVYGFKLRTAEAEKALEPLQQTAESELNTRRYERMNPVVRAITSASDCGSPSVVDDFVSTTLHRASLPAMNTAKIRFKANTVIDYFPNMTPRSDGIIEYRLTMYQYLPKSKKHNIIGQFIFEFEGTSDLVAAFRYIDRSQIANLETLQKQLEAR